MSLTSLEDGVHDVHGKRARLVICAFSGCGRTFLLCTHCDRGNKYCSKACSGAARKRYLVAVRRKYAASPEGREDHRARMERYRDERRQARRVVDQRRQKPTANRNVAPRSAPTIASIAVDAGVKADACGAPPGRNVPPLFPHTRTAPVPAAAPCDRCRRYVTTVTFVPPRRN
jgi:hypothetical protein